MPPQVAPMAVALGLVPALMSPQRAPMAVALGLVPVWCPKKAKLALLPPQVAPLAVALELVPALARCLVRHLCTPFFRLTSGFHRPWGQLSLGPLWSTSRSTHCWHRPWLSCL